MKLIKEPWLPMLVFFATAALSGCGSFVPSFPEEQELPVAAVVNTIKCEINDFFYEQQQTAQKQTFRLKLDKTALATIKLNLRVTKGGGLSYSHLEVSGTPFQSIISINPNRGPFSAGGSASSALAVEVALSMEQSASKALDCRHRKMARTDDLKLKDWLVKFMNEGQTKIISEGPTTRLSEIILTTGFEVVASAGINPTIAIVPVFVPPSATAQQVRTHQLQIILKGDNQLPQPPPPAAANASAKAKPRTP